MSFIPHAFRRSGLGKGAKKDPELYVLLALMVGTLSLSGFYFGRNPTSKQADEARINITRNSAPWNAREGEIENNDRGNYKYMYHPHADYRNEPRKAPGALNAVVVPAVSLPKHLHDKFNKYGKDNY